MSNTQKRVIFGFLMAASALACIMVGKTWALCGILLVGVFCIDELFCHFFLGQRFSISYFLSLVAFIAPYIYFNFVDLSPGLMSIFYNGGILFNSFMLAYLFFEKFEANSFIKFGERFPYLAVLMILFPLMSLGSLFLFERWQALLGAFLFINFGMDTGAWFFGRKFGKRKLWEAISPNKTIEGAIGGALSSGILGGGFWYLSFGEVNLMLLLVMSLLGVLSHLGDLIQSKLKRQRGIKDSSRLIPGHGGAYDRVDSLIFLAPFFAVVVKYIYSA